MPFLTTMREALLNALDNWEPLEEFELRKWFFREEDVDTVEDGMPPTPALGELPALIVFPAPSLSGWHLNQSQRVEYTLNLMLWTRFATLPEAEKIWEEIMRGIWQARPSATAVPYTQQNGMVVTAGVFTPEIAVLSGGTPQDGPFAVRWTMPITLMKQGFNPRQGSTQE